MKIKTKKLPYEKVLQLPPYRHRRPKKPMWLFSTLMYLLSKPALWATRFSYKKIGMERLGKKEPCLYLMNHSSFIDLKIASGMLYPKPYNIVCTLDGFVGKAFLMRNLGCIPTKKFVPQLELVRDMIYSLKTLKTSVFTNHGLFTKQENIYTANLTIDGIPVYVSFSEDGFLQKMICETLNFSAQFEIDR